MELGSIFLVLAILVIIGIYLYLPFTKRTHRLKTGENLEISALKAERDRIVNALQELDFDYNLDKVPAADYSEQRAALLQKGADVLRKLDELAPVASSASNAEARIEKAAAAGRADAVEPVFLPPSDEDIEALIAARRKDHKRKSAGFCPKCGKAILVSDKFCPACGKSVN